MSQQLVKPVKPNCFVDRSTGHVIEPFRPSLCDSESSFIVSLRNRGLLKILVEEVPDSVTDELLTKQWDVIKADEKFVDKEAALVAWVQAQAKKQAA